MLDLKIIRVIFAALLTSLATLVGAQDVPAPGQADLSLRIAQAAAAYNAEDWPAAESQYIAIVAQEPVNARAWYRLGNIYSRTQRSMLAFSAYAKALAQNPDYTDAWYNLGLLQLRQAWRSFEQTRRSAVHDTPALKRSNRMLAAIEVMLRER